MEKNFQDFDSIFNKLFPIFKNFEIIFSQINEDLESQNSRNRNYPPYNIYVEKIIENNENIDVIILEMAVAGFDPEKVKEGISFKNNVFKIDVDKISDDENRLYLKDHKKLALRAIKKELRIPYEVSEIDVDIKNGILKVVFHQAKNNNTKINFK